MSIALSACNMLLGSVANKVLHIAKVPVLLVE
jgi:nucleotide-binding universal stress UspA family protein